MAKDGSRNEPTQQELANPATAALTRLVSLQATSEETSERVGSLERTIRGSNGNAGVMTRLDRLEQWLDRHTWTERTIKGGIAVLAIAAFWKAMSG